MSEVFLGLYTMGAMNLLADRPFSTKDRFGREMLDPFVGFSDINQHEFAPAPNLPQYDRLEIVTAVYQYVYTRTTGTNAGYTADYVTPGNANSLVYRMYNEGTAVFALYPWTSSDPLYIPYGTSQIPFPGTALTVPYYGNFGAGSPGINGNGRYLTYNRYVLTARLYKTVSDDPCYLDLVTGYTLDSRSIPDKPTIVPAISKTVELRYYQRNHLEPIPDLTSICWRVYTCTLIENIPQELPITRCVLGTLYCNDANILATISALPTASGKYDWSDLSPANIPALFVGWKQLQANSSPPQGQPLEYIVIRKLAANNNHWNNTDLSNNVDINFDIAHPIFAVNNQRAYDWHIKPQSDGSYGDLIMDSPRTIEIHAALQANNYLVEVPAIIGNGTIDNPQVPAKHTLGYWISHPVVGDSTKVNEIHTALNASQYLLEAPATVGTGTTEAPQTPAKHKLDYYIRNSASEKVTAIWKALGGDKYSVNEIDDTKPRITTLGYLIENIARILGLRLDANGEIDLVKEKRDYLPQTINKPTLGLPSASGKYNSYGLSCWGTKGMIMPHLPTSYNQNGKLETLFDVVHDIPQQQMAILRQLDVALSIQHGSEIRVNGLDGKIHCYPNHLAVQLECLQKLEKVAYQVDKTLLVSTVAGTEIRELFSGIGIPVTQKFLPLKDPSNSKKVLSLPYFGHQKNQPSTAGLLANVQINLAVINGVLMPKKQPDASITNPFKRFVASE